jgi:uncharacterized repeat protein (TIGR01451 family)
MRPLVCIALLIAGCNSVLDISEPHEGASDLALRLTAQPAVANDTLTHHLTVSNDGDIGAHAVVVTLTLPIETSMLAVAAYGWTCSTVANVVTCTLADLEVGGESFITTYVRAPEQGSVLVATARVTAETADLDDTNNTAMTMTAINAAADLAIAITGSPNPVPAAGSVTYAIEVANLGPSTATDVAVQLVPTDVMIGEASGDGWSCSGTTCVLVTPVSVGMTRRLTVSGRATGSLATMLTSWVTSSTMDPQPANNSATAGTTVTPLADLSLTMTDSPDPASSGGTLTYTLVVQNTGPSDASQVTVSDSLPAGFALDTISATGWGWTTSSGTVTLTRSLLAPGAAPPIMLTGHVLAASGTLTSSATVTSNTMDPVSTNNSTSESTVLLPPADLSIAVTDSPDPVTEGGTLTYSIVVTNAGPGDATAATMTDSLPAGVMFVSATGNGWSCALSGSTVTCTQSLLPVGAAPPISIVVTAPYLVLGPNTLSNVARINAATSDPYTGNNTFVSTTVVTH